MAQRKGVTLVLLLVIGATVFSLSLVLGAYALMSVEPAVPDRATIVLRIDGLAEGSAGSVANLFTAERSLTLDEVRESLARAKADPRVASVIIRPGDLPAAYWAKIQDVRDAILDFRQSGKPAFAYLEYGGQREYYLATACDQVVLMPNSPLELTGLVSYELFLRGALDRIGAYPDMHHVGEYKTAANQLTEQTFTAEHREMSESLNRDLFEQLVRGVAEGRNKTEAEVRALVDQGPFLAEAARDAGLVDAVVYEDQLGDLITGASDELRLLEGVSYARGRSTSLGFGRGSRIGVIHVAGTIASGRSGVDPIFGGVAGSDSVIEQIRRARNDASLRATILRIDSPGGSTIASDVIWRELAVTREEHPDRPLVVSMSDLAASGGYYIAMPADAIVAQPGTLTGSIGIYGGKILTGGVYEKLGMNIETVSAGRFADMNSPVRPYDEAEQAKLQEQLLAFYEQFVRKVAESRQMSPEQVEALAQGRVWTGRQAKEIGLVDELGGFAAAVALAKQRADLPADAEVELIEYLPRRGVFELLLEGFARVGQGRLPAVAPELVRALAPLAHPAGLFRRGEALALMPFPGR